MYTYMSSRPKSRDLAEPFIDITLFVRYATYLAMTKRVCFSKCHYEQTGIIPHFKN